MSANAEAQQGARVIFIPPPLYYAAGLAGGMAINGVVALPLGGRPSAACSGGSSHTVPNQQGAIMNIEAFTQLFDEVFTKGHLDATDQLVAPEIIDHQFTPDGSSGRTLTRDQFKTFVQALRAGIPDLHYT